MSMKPIKKSKTEEKTVGSIKDPTSPATESSPSQVGKLGTLRPAKSEAFDKAPAIDEAIEIALEAASTAVDSALEIQRIRAEAFKLITETKKSSRLLLYSAALIFMLAGVAVFGSLVYFKRAMNDLDLITKVNRDALLIFSGEINGLVSVGRKIDENVKSSSLALEAVTLSHSDLTKRVQVLTNALTEASANIVKLAAQEQQYSELKKSLDDLSFATRSANARAADLISAASRPAPSAPRSQARPSTRPPVTTRPRSSRPAAASPRDSMIRYP